MNGDLIIDGDGLASIKLSIFEGSLIFQIDNFNHPHMSMPIEKIDQLVEWLLKQKEKHK